MGIATIRLDMGTTTIHTDMAIIRMDTTDLIGTTAIPTAPGTIMGTVTTAIIGIIITTATKLK